MSCGDRACTTAGLCAIGLTIAFPILFGVGYARTNAGEAFDPAVDFVRLDTECLVTGVDLVQSFQRKTDGSPTECIDTFVLEFNATTTNTTTNATTNTTTNTTTTETAYRSAGIRISRTGRRAYSCTASEPSVPEQSVGDVLLPCWKPSDPASVPTLKASRSYRCGNDDCVKILDPADDYDEEFFRNEVMIGLGYFLGGLAFISCAICLLADPGDDDDAPRHPKPPAHDDVESAGVATDADGEHTDGALDSARGVFLAVRPMPGSAVRSRSSQTTEAPEYDETGRPVLPPTKASAAAA